MGNLTDPHIHIILLLLVNKEKAELMNAIVNLATLKGILLWSMVIHLGLFLDKKVECLRNLLDIYNLDPRIHPRGGLWKENKHK